MESESTVMLESCGEDSILMQTVKNMVTENVHAELESEEEGFFVVTDVEHVQQNVTEVCNEESAIIENEERVSWSNLCRICANTNDHLIPIFDGEGLQHDLCSKIHKYLPIHISQTDVLPLQLCYHCAATLLAWHELLEGCLTAERRLLDMQETLQEKQSTEGLEVSVDTSMSNIAESLHQEQEIVKDEDCGEMADNDMNRWKNEPDDRSRSPTVDNEPNETNAEEVEYVQCTQCDVVFVSLKYFVEHMNTAHQTEVHYCQYCKLMYHGQLKDFDEHMLMHNGDGVPSNAVAEDQPLGTKDPLKIEISHNLEPVKARFICNLCSRKFTKKSELKKHIINKHSDTNRIENPDETELLNSARMVVDDRVTYNCHTCSKMILTKRGFLRHIRVHSDKRPCKCDQCGKSYRIEQDLARHVRDVHEGLKKYACDICGRAFANKGAKDDHRRIHTGERPYACEHCPKTFRTLNSIYIHNRVHTDYKPHKCSYCGKHFRSKQRLTHHETTHTGIKAFACEVCGKTFSVKGEVVRHRAIHNEEKPFDCKCGMKFGQKRYLRNHIKQHHKEASSWLLEELLGSN